MVTSIFTCCCRMLWLPSQLCVWASFPRMQEQRLRPLWMPCSRVAIVHSWYSSDHGCILCIHSSACGPFSLGIPLCQVPTLAAHNAAVAERMLPSNPGSGIAGWFPTAHPHCLCLTPKLQDAQGTQLKHDNWSALLGLSHKAQDFSPTVLAKFLRWAT